MSEMPHSTDWRLILDPPAAGAWNMAVDEVLLQWAAEHDRCCFRIYYWERPTISLGYFQPYDDRCEHGPSRNCPAVRRLTGGGAIVHDVELTYSVVVPAGHPLARRRERLYDAAHRSLIETLAAWSIEATLCQGAATGAPEEEPFLCFRRRSPGDVLVGSTKIAGSAQRRRRGAVLQHGSVLLGCSQSAPRLPGLAEVAGKAVAAEALAEAWLGRLAKALSAAWCEGPLSGDEQHRAGALVKSRYGSCRWTERRGR